MIYRRGGESQDFRDLTGVQVAGARTLIFDLPTDLDLHNDLKHALTFPKTKGSAQKERKKSTVWIMRCPGGGGLLMAWIVV